eukprot:GFYU01001818.1.p1 GENE.GFYU01001818.1~~GFYU01001818.1.p1  ORF type:complete len:225 (+),score=23.78 GFYU01001818.1:105-779(+)
MLAWLLCATLLLAQCCHSLGEEKVVDGIPNAFIHSPNYDAPRAAILGDCCVNVPCSQLPITEVLCDYDDFCLGTTAAVQATCHAKPLVTACEGPRNFTRTFHCRPCASLPESLTLCYTRMSCQERGDPVYATATCRPLHSVMCIGATTWEKKVNCNLASGHKWSTAMWLSLTLGGFAADRFYLGYVGWGFFKLLTFGGIGVWTIVDFILLATGVLVPADDQPFV